MKHSAYQDDQFFEDRFGLKLAAHLSRSTEALPHDISERLRVARQQAIARHKQRQPVLAGGITAVGGASAALTLGRNNAPFGLGLWRSIASLIPLLALVAGLFAIQSLTSDNLASELAQVDAALLTDDLPPAAYADPGFLQFLKHQFTAAE